jgi:hypothetical protein
MVGFGGSAGHWAPLPSVWWIPLGKGLEFKAFLTIVYNLNCDLFTRL